MRGSSVRIRHPAPVLLEILIMEALATISALMNIFSKCFDLAKKLNQEEREDMCTLLKEIGDLLKEVALDLSSGVYPANKCAQMEIYMQGLENFLSGKISEEQKQQLVSWMIDAVKIEQLLGQLSGLSEDERKFHLNGVNTLAGKFSATARLLELQ